MRCRNAVFAGMAAAGIIALASTIPASAHHSFAAEFDADKPVSVQGVITQVRLENPHSWFFIDVTNAKGQVEKWSFEGSTPTSLIRSGVKPGTIKAGDVVTIRGYHARDMTVNVGAAREIVMADGRSFAVGPAFGGR
jgi:DNA/RNA endonuclease YhcR with UshA esterase domain